MLLSERDPSTSLRASARGPEDDDEPGFGPEEFGSGFAGEGR
jgi:hypothetical protein